MNLRRRAALGGGVVLAVLCGTWLGHAAEYLRVHPEVGLTTAVTGPVHGYLLPVGLGLATAAAIGAAMLWRLWEGLGRRLDALGAAVSAMLRGRRPRPGMAAASGLRGTPPSGATTAGRLMALWLLLGVAQLVLYVAQENLEAHRAGVPMPGIGALLGVHWAASLIHLEIALLVAALLLYVARRFGARIAALVRRAAWVRFLLGGFDAPARTTPSAEPPPSRRPRWLVGALWRRPPPRLLPV